ncbi:hypothetical protein M413DRAFT_31645 [Hebeloma cylindrosporum]|uniref:F-BAR domain-containing protein n=1 Tax=Hebeloma cylindrosporum TaxID=76867 RepID=A0A0C3BI59_HEBCY|nr:hypothetical protein M413DRAFT_31645 [Hebeloma cylindrosporum h7]
MAKGHHSSIPQNRPLYSWDSFWGFGDGGVNPLFERMRGAARTMEELKAFWKERASIEEEYAKRLAKLAKMTLGREETGELRKSLDALRTETMHQAGFHLDLALRVRAELEVQTTEFHARQRTHKKIYQAPIERQFKTGKIQESSVNKAREKHEQDCAWINAFTVQASLLHGKALETINLKVERAQQTAQSSAREFLKLSKTLRETGMKWEQDWKLFCGSCEDMERDRVEFMKDQLWHYANVVSTVCVADDASSQSIRVAIDRVDAEKDLGNFVREHRHATKNQIPEPPPIVAHRARKSILAALARPNSSASHLDRSILVTPEQLIAPLQDLQQVLKIFSNNIFSSARLLTLPNHVVHSAQLLNITFSNDSPLHRLHRRYVVKTGRQNPNAATRLFSLYWLSEKAPEQRGLIILVFICGEIIGAYLSRTLSIYTRVKMVLRAHFYFDIWLKFFGIGGYSMARYYVSPQCVDIMKTLLHSFLQFVIIYRDHGGGRPLLPWRLSSEMVDHLLGMCRQIFRDFTMLDFHRIFPKLFIRTPESHFSALAANGKPPARSNSQIHTDIRDMLAALSTFPTDVEIQRAAHQAYDEARSTYARVESIILLPNVSLLPGPSSAEQRSCYPFGGTTSSR